MSPRSPLLLAVLLCTGAPLAAQPLDERIEEFRAFLVEHRRQTHVQSLSVALAKDDKVVFAEGFGWQDHDAEERTTAQTTYLVASITKTFTAATLLAMAADGHIDLDDDFTKLSDWNERCRRLTGSGSIFGGGTLDGGKVIPPLRCTEPISLRRVLQHRVNGEPGSAFLYNPVVFGRLSNWVEEQTGRAWREWVYEYVISPAGLDDTAAGWRDPAKGHVLTRLAPPFRLEPDDDDHVAPSILPNPELNASSGIIAGVLDLAKYSMALDQGKILSPELRETMWTPPRESNGTPAPYAYGWYSQQWRDHRLVWHAGWWPDAYAGLLLKAPEDGWTLVALGNTDGLRWGNPLDAAEVQNSEVAAEFLRLFVAR